MADFYVTLARVQDLLQREGRLSYRGLKRQFGVDDAFVEDLKLELVETKRLARDEGGSVLVWTGPRVEVAPAAPQASPLAYTPPHLTEQILASRGAIEGERKLVTACFADIKGSTELIEDLDPEEAQKLLDPAVRLMMEAVHRFEGTVTQVAGDGIVALFGAPLAHEDHALRACYAALAMQAAMRGLTEEVRRTRGLALHLRVGLNSGEVVVRSIRTDLHMDYSAVGATVHLAARMEQLASPGTILVTGDTLRLVEGLVLATALGPTPVKGIAEPVDVFELTGASAVRRRLQAASARGLTRFVGRDAEIGALNRTLEHAAGGHGQVVAVQGEAGVGKSRLVHEFVQSHRAQTWLVLDSAAQSFGVATAYLPVIDLLRRYAGIDDHDDARAARAKLTGRVVTLDATLQDALPALLGLLDLLPPEDPFRALDPAQRRPRTQEALTRLVLREAEAQPLLLMIEDLHWIDSESSAWLDRLVESVPASRVLLLVNYRPEHRHGWGAKSFYTQLRLDPLSPADAASSLSTMIGDDPELAALKRQLIERTQGNPFFLEESVHTLVETGALAGEPGRYRLATAAPAIQMPATVQAVIAARMD
ncbi:MAG: hypothetical protein FJX57_15855, partial [Alphaproteobacteria bacterium]|nr:hypothetical protein [Alphaproteobacteria bacterium]